MISKITMKGLFLVFCICCLYHRGEPYGLYSRTKKTTTTTTTPLPEITSNYNAADGCWRGTCIESRKCISPNSTALEPTGSCGRKHGTWVCCLKKKHADSPTLDRRSTSAWFPSSSTTPSSLRDFFTRSTTIKPNYGFSTRSNTIIPSSARYIHGADYWGSSKDYFGWGNNGFVNRDENSFGHGFGASSDTDPSYGGVDNAWYDDYPTTNEWNNRRSDWPHRESPSSSDSDGCEVGRCMQRSECNTWSSTVLQATGQCSQRSGYNWICCKEGTYSIGTRPPTSSYTTSTTTETPYRSTPGNTWKKTTRSTTVRTTTKPKKTDGCIAGKCVKPEDCSSSGSVALSATGLCGKRRLGQWVCCLQNATETDTGEGSRRDESPNRRVHSTSTTTRRTTSTTTPTPKRHSYSGCGLRDGFTGRTSRARNNYEMMPNAEIIDSTLAVWENDIHARIVGGREATPYSWPWVAALFRENSPGTKRFLCAGSLISDRYILSAAHVFAAKDIAEASSFIIRLGTHTGTENFGEYRVRKIKLHPEYQHRYYYNDIALLELEQPVTYNKFVFPVCLPPSNAYCTDSEIVGKNVTVTGWGDVAFGGKSSDVLKEATFPIVSRQTCNSSYIQVASSKFPRGITEKMLCAGAPNGGKDACQGDSGGPLTLKEGKHWIQVGVVSFGYRCGDSQYPGVYTKVGYYVDWIKTNANIQR